MYRIYSDILSVTDYCIYFYVALISDVAKHSILFIVRLLAVPEEESNKFSKAESS